MLKRSLHRLTRRLRVASFVPLAWWVWKYRSALRRALPLAKTAPRRILAGEGAEVLTEAKVLCVLATTERTHRQHAVAVSAVRDGVVELRIAAAHADAAAVLLNGPDVRSVDVAPATTTAPLSGIPVHSLAPEQTFA